MADPDSGLLEQGFFSLYASDGPGAGGLLLVLSPEGDTHRLISLEHDGRRLRGQVRVVAGRMAAIQAALPKRTRTVALGRYRLERLGTWSRIDFTSEELGHDLTPNALINGEGWSLRVAPPVELAQRRGLPIELRARWRGQDEVPLDRPHALDYVGVRLSLARAGMALTEGGSAKWAGGPTASRWTG